MDRKLKNQLRERIKKQGVPATIELDNSGYWLVLHGRKTRLVLSSIYEPSILEVVADVSALASDVGGKS